ncbi:MAG: DNA-formamidopyrimidine glycosylase [Chloroflexaceae bacterium]|nr:DNA-formamidopyrimidine glycosylase [Chloroflexaceae bacterium]
MPELPEVETIRRGLASLTAKQEIRGGEVLLPRSLAYPLSVSEFWEALRGSCFERWERRGKYLLAALGRQDQPAGWLGVHLRMTGQLLWLGREEPLQSHVRLRFFVGERHELRFVDIRTFGKIWWVPPDQAPKQIIIGLQALGPEPNDPAFTLDYLARQLQKSHRPIKTLLLDQKLVAGLGNIYADEVLFDSAIAPTAIASQLTPAQIPRLHRAIQTVLQAAIARGGTTFSNYLNLLGVSGNYGEVAWVYGRTGKPCRRCGTPISRLKLAGRSAHFCPACQPVSPEN